MHLWRKISVKLSKESARPSGGCEQSTWLQYWEREQEFRHWQIAQLYSPVTLTSEWVSVLRRKVYVCAHVSMEISTRMLIKQCKCSCNYAHYTDLFASSGHVLLSCNHDDILVYLVTFCSPWCLPSTTDVWSLDTTRSFHQRLYTLVIYVLTIVKSCGSYSPRTYVGMEPTAKQALTRDLYNILSTWMFQKTLDDDGYSCFAETEAMLLCNLLRWEQKCRHIEESSLDMYSFGLPTKLFLKF
jgi:hypothetical protein